MDHQLTTELGPVDIDTLQMLDDFLASERAPDEGMHLSDLDGFLTALAVNPKRISPKELLPVIWGEGEPAFADDQEAEWVINTILRRYNEIHQTLSQAPHELTPVFWEGADGEAIVDDWATGFLEAVATRADDWRPLFNDKDAFLAIAPIVIAGQDLETLKEMDVDADTKAQAHRDLPDVLTVCLVSMRDFLAEHADAHDNENSPPARH